MKNNDEFAFPTMEKVDVVAITKGGLTIRDYFAAKALNGMLAKSAKDYGWFTHESPDKGAALAYSMADAMLKERNK